MKKAKRFLKKIIQDDDFLVITYLVALYIAIYALKPVLEPALPFLYVRRPESVLETMKFSVLQTLFIISTAIILAMLYPSITEIITWIKTIRWKRNRAKMDEELAKIFQELDEKIDIIEENLISLDQSIVTTNNSELYLSLHILKDTSKKIIIDGRELIASYYISKAERIINP